MIKLNSELLEIEDITDQCVFSNCTLREGKIFVNRTSKILYIGVSLTATLTHDWQTVITIPSDINPIAVVDNGIALVGTDFWIYSGHNVKGPITKGTSFGIYSLAPLQ